MTLTTEEEKARILADRKAETDGLAKEEAERTAKEERHKRWDEEDRQRAEPTTAEKIKALEDEYLVVEGNTPEDTARYRRQIRAEIEALRNPTPHPMPAGSDKPFEAVTASEPEAVQPIPQPSPTPIVHKPAQVPRPSSSRYHNLDTALPSVSNAPDYQLGSNS